MQTAYAARFVAGCAILAGMATACSREPVVDVGPGVALDLATRRAAAISDLRYDLRFVIPAARAEPITGTRDRVVHAEPSAGSLIFDFAQPADSVHAVRVGGQPVDFEARDEHVIVSAAAVSPGALVVDIEFTAGDGSLNRQDDFLYTLFVPDRARVAFPLFDQPNLKARFRLQLDLPAAWRAVANGSLASHEVRGDRALFAFTETDAISSYLFAFAAGEFEVEDAQRGGRRMAMYHRETDRERVTRNADDHLRSARGVAGVAGGVHRHSVSVREVRRRARPGLPVRRDGAPGGDLLPRGLRCCSTRAPRRTPISAGPA